MFLARFFHAIYMKGANFLHLLLKGVDMNYAQTIKAICNSCGLRLTVGKAGQISDKLAAKIVDTGNFKATFWGFDNDNNKIVAFKYVGPRI